MKQSLQLGIGLTVFILFLAFINLQPKKKDINWKPTFSQHDKNPFGTYVLYQELEEWIPKEDINLVTDVSLFRDLDIDADTSYILNDTIPSNLIIIRPELYMYTYEEEKLLDYISKGNTVFISSSVFPYHFFNLLDTTLTLEYNYSDDPVYITSLNQDSLIFPKGEFEYSFYDSLNTYETFSYTKHLNGELYSGLIEIPYGEGTLILHSFPYALSNYYLLHEDKAYQAYATDILNMFPKQKTHWVTVPTSDSRQSNNKGLLTIIRQIPQLFSAWKLLLIGLLVYVLFKAKREQRLIPIIPELKNTSKAYIKVISNLHHEEKNYLNLVHKKMLFFFDQIKTHVHIDINHLSDPKTIVNKTQSSEKDVVRLLALINQCHNQQVFTKEEFIEFCTLADKILKS